MQLETSRFFNDRLIFDETCQSKFQKVSGFWQRIERIIYWFFSPAEYSAENQRTVDCFKRYLIDTLGTDRLQRISSRYELNWDAMRKNPLTSRDVAKIFIGSKCVSVADVNEFIEKNPQRFPGKKNFLELDAMEMHSAQIELGAVFNSMWSVAEIAGRISGGPTQSLSRIFFDPLLLDRERLQLVKDHPADTFEFFMHNMLARVIKKEPPVGSLIPAPNDEGGKLQFYYVSGKLVTGKGMVSYILHPATSDTCLKPIRLFRGTSTRNSEIDALSTIITDLEKDLGMSAYKSGLVYEEKIKEMLGDLPKIEGGHSMGATLVQHRLAHLDHIRKAYLYCGPGITEHEVNTFNEKNRKVKLIIRVADSDDLHRLGQAHLGYQSPTNVKVDFKKYRSIQRSSVDPHIALWHKQPANFASEEISSSERRNESLYHRNRRKEYYRSLIGPFMAAGLILLRDLIRFFFNSRIHVERGLRVGRLNGNHWEVAHFRPV